MGKEKKKKIFYVISADINECTIDPLLCIIETDSKEKVVTYLKGKYGWSDKTIEFNYNINEETLIKI